jgi:hypothetical protein
MRAASLRAMLERALEARAERSARVRQATGLPDLLARLGRRYAGLARRRGLQLALDVDPALATDLVGPFGSLGRLLQRVIEHAMAHPIRGRVALAVDVVHDAAGRQTVHFTVECMRSPGLDMDRAWGALHGEAEALGGALLLELGESCHLIVALAFIVPPAPPHVDIVALRAMVGGDVALHQVVDALADALAADVGDLAGTLARGDVPAVRHWLHRVSGALGMVEATGLATMGLQLEHDMAVRSLDDMAPGLRRFATDATRALAWLRESLAADPLI